MNAPNMSQTVVLEKPDNAHLIESPGFGPTKPKTAIRNTPINPIAAAGIGSRIRPKITAQNMAKKYHAVKLSPCGAGNKAIVIPKSKGRIDFQIDDFILTSLCRDLQYCIKLVRGNLFASN
jgi:hypothetical protein